MAPRQPPGPLATAAVSANNNAANGMNGDNGYYNDSDTSGYLSSDHESSSVTSAPLSAPSSPSPPPPSPSPPRTSFENLIPTARSSPPHSLMLRLPTPPTLPEAVPPPTLPFTRAYSPQSPVPVSVDEEIPDSPESPTPSNGGSDHHDDHINIAEDTTTYNQWVTRRRLAQRTYDPAAPIDTTGLPPPNKVPLYYYVVLMNFRNTEPETRELVYRVATNYGSVTDFGFRRGVDITINYYVGYFTISQSVACVLWFPKHLAARAVFARIAATDFNFDESNENEPVVSNQNL